MKTFKQIIMKHIYFILILCISLGVSAQTTVNFTSTEGYADGGLQAHADWYAAANSPVNHFTVDATAGTVTSTNEEFKKAVWKQPFDLNASGDKIKFTVNFKLLGTLSATANVAIIKIGFTPVGGGGTTGADESGVTLAWSNWNQHLQMRNEGNGAKLDTPSNGAASLLYSDLVGDDLAVEVSLNIAETAAASTISAKLLSLTDGTSSDEAFDNSTTSVPQVLYDAATSTGSIYGFFSNMSMGNANLTGVEYSSVSMEPTVLSISDVSLPEFLLSNNPVGESVEISGVEAGSEINIYTITGAKASNHVYNGSSLNLSHLNTGVYFMETPGFAVKKMLKK